MGQPRPSAPPEPPAPALPDVPPVELPPLDAPPAALPPLEAPLTTASLPPPDLAPAAALAPEAPPSGWLPPLEEVPATVLPPVPFHRVSELLEPHAGTPNHKSMSSPGATVPHRVCSPEILIMADHAPRPARHEPQGGAGKDNVSSLEFESIARCCTSLAHLGAVPPGSGGRRSHCSKPSEHLRGGGGQRANDHCT